MKRKHFYMLLMVSCLGMLSLANQNNQDCKKVSYCSAAMKACSSGKTPGETKTTGKVTPLNLLLFDL